MRNPLKEPVPVRVRVIVEPELGFAGFTVNR
jgi:hypothetical protein